MDSINTKRGKDGIKEEHIDQYAIESIESEGENFKSNRCRNKSVPEQNLISNFRRSRSQSSCRELVFRNTNGSYSTIPKHITTFDEKYVLHCFELIRNYAFRAATRNFTSKVDLLQHDLSKLTAIRIGSLYDMATGTEVAVNSTGDWTIGTVTGSQSMINILKSPLLQQFGSRDADVNFGRKSLVDDSEPVYSNFVGSPQEPNNDLSYKPQKEATVLEPKYVSTPAVHRRIVSMSSTNSTCSDKSSSSSSAPSYQGMLQCKWNNGLPHHVFTVDDRKEVYVANLSKIESSNDKDLDYVYNFHKDLENVGKMRVSTSITIGSINSEIRETQFIFYVPNDDPTGEQQVSSHTLKKNSKRLTRKVVDVFRASNFRKQRSSSKFGGSDAIFEDAPWEPSEDGAGAEKSYIPNLELAAIIVKDICKIREEADLGGWGLKFLKRSRNEVSTVVPSECTRSNEDCSTSMNIIVPAGIHGGPRTRIGGPSGLMQRWISGGHCDCGGWDIGCPLTVLNTRSSSTDSSDHTDDSGGCQSVELFVQGLKQDVPVLKMVNIHDGLYYIHFQSALSSLQSFAIAAAVIHSRSPLLRSKLYRS